MDKPLGWEFKKDGWVPDADDVMLAAANTIQMQMMTGYGDLKKIWNAANEVEVEDARRSFNHLVKDKKYLAFRVGEDGKKGSQIRDFEPEAGKMILIPPLAGG